jgi:hypothetical protein
MHCNRFSCDQVNTLNIDVTAWHPLTVGELLEASPLQRKLLRLIATTPLKLFASIGMLFELIREELSRLKTANESG